MTARRSLLPEPLPLIAIALSGAIVAALAPFDSAFAIVTAGSAVARVLLLLALALTGAACARRLGLRLAGDGAIRSAVIGLTAAAAMAGYCLVIDCVAMRGQVDPGLARFLQEPLATRLLYFMPRAFNESVLYRLFLFPLLALGIGTLGRNARTSGRPPFSILLGAMIAAQLVNIGINVVALAPGPQTATILAYDLPRFVLPGVAWALLFWRFSFVTMEIASVGCHLFLQPGYSLLF